MTQLFDGRRPHLIRAFLLVVGLLGAATSLGAQGSATGTLFGRWGDPLDRSQPPQLEWSLLQENGQVIDVAIPPALVARIGGVPAVDRRRVTVSGTRVLVRGPGGRMQPLLQATAVRPLAAAAFGGALAAPQLGTKPYAILLCKFSDVAAQPGTTADYVTLFSNSYPNIDHYYREQSNNQINMTGTQAFGWFTLPQPKSFYVTASSTNLSQMASDCVAAADPTVDFNQFFGVATQYNSTISPGSGGGSSYGGSAFVTVEGQGRLLPMTWMADWAAATQPARYGIYSHEIGHSLGLPHSSGPYSAVYDSRWDVMSNAYNLWDPVRLAWLQPGTIIFHKDLLGWIPSARKLVVANPSTQQVTLEQSVNPPANNNPLMVQIPIPGSTSYYTVEARRLIGYDQTVPGEAVVIHKVTSAYARVVDPDNNQDPNDAAAMWIVGETFTDGTGVSVRIDAKTATGWTITVGIQAAQCTITTSSNPSVGGSTSGGGTVSCGTPVTVTATPNAGYSFVNWTENGTPVSTSAAYQFTPNANRTLVANFTQSQTVTVSTSSSPANGGTTSGGGSFASGAQVTVIATPATGYNFVNWTENGTAVSTNTNYTFTANTNRTLVANFALKQYAITTASNPTAGGTTSGGGTVNHGSLVTVVATPAAGYNFVHWLEGTTVVSTATSYQFTATAARHLVAVFTGQQYTITTVSNPANGGSISGGGTASQGSQVTLVASPAIGFEFVSWTENGTVVSASATYQFTATGNRTLTANFVRSQVTVVVSANPAAGGTVTGGGTVAYGTVVNVTATPAAGYNFVNWTEGGTAVSTASSLSFPATASRNLVANFALRSYTVTTSSTPVDGGTTSGGGTYTHGTTVTVAATPGRTFAFMEWRENGAAVSSATPYQFSVTANRTLVATFQAIDVQGLTGRLVAALLVGTVNLPAHEMSWLDNQGNRNGSVDLGDLLALLDKNPTVQLSQQQLEAVLTSPRARGVRVPLTKPDQ